MTVICGSDRVLVSGGGAYRAFGHSNKVFTIVSISNPMQGNHRFVSNADQERCKHCGLFVSKGNPNNGMYRYQCNRCGPVLEYESKQQASA